MKPVPPPERPISALGLVIPDLIQLSVFASSPVAAGDISEKTANAHRYFSSCPGARPHGDEQDRQGPGYVWKQGELSLKLYIKRSFSMSVRFNLQRIAAARCGLPGAKERHGNVVRPLLADGYDLASIRQGMCSDIVDLTRQAKEIYEELCPKAFGVPVVGEVHANLSFVELAIDQPGDAELMKNYQRAFRKVVGL